MDERIVTVERRREKRLEEENEMTISVLSGGKNIPKERIIYTTLSKDISVSGARIQSHSFLPVDTSLEIKVALKNPSQIITAFGKVKWIKNLFGGEFYEAGLEFVSTSR
jgi:hypothetical protein